jgi:hypothetical protein
LSTITHEPLARHVDAPQKDVVASSTACGVAEGVDSWAFGASP